MNKGPGKPNQGGRSYSGASKPASNLPKPPASIKNTPASLNGRCNCCGFAAHMKKDCKRMEKAKCSNCNMKGHYSNVCLSEYLAWKKKAKKEAKIKGTAAEEPLSAPPSDAESEDSD